MSKICENSAITILHASIFKTKENLKYMNLLFINM